MPVPDIIFSGTGTGTGTGTYFPPSLNVGNSMMGERMPALIPTETDQDVLTLKVQGAQAILAGLKTFLKVQKKMLTDQVQLSACIDILYEFTKALETPYPPNIVSAGFSYAWDSKKYTEAGASVVHDVTTRIIPETIHRTHSLTLTEHSQQLICTVLKYLIAVQLGENEKQDAVARGEAGRLDMMAYDVLQKQKPQMDFRRVSNLLITPLIAALREKLSIQAAVSAVSTSA